MGTGGQFKPTGELAGWDVRDRLHEVTVPALVTHVLERFLDQVDGR